MSTRTVKKLKVQQCHDLDHKHDHSAVIPATRRILGQMRGVEKMIEDGRYCPDIITQIRAVHAALRSLESKILEDHLRSCVLQCFLSNNQKEKEAKIKEVSDLFKRP